MLLYLEYNACCVNGSLQSKSLKGHKRCGEVGVGNHLLFYVSFDKVSMLVLVLKE
jgi:hypothetical protein